MSDGGLLYLVSDYGATGEGRTLSILITHAFPAYDDYSTKPAWTDGVYDAGTLKNSIQDIAKREFAEKFGEWFSVGVEIMDRYEFFHLYGTYVPEYVHKMTDPEKDPPYFNYFSQTHYNYS